ncbi:MAG TPA: hypothetical protein VKH37_10170, partial [Ferruginibacter sp.]|nr:hypothetical protein [Ferruginibacter sp.]
MNLSLFALALSTMIVTVVKEKHVTTDVKQSKETIIKISYSTTGGRGGNTESLDVTKMSTVFTKGHAGVDKTTKAMTSKTFWAQITNALDLKNFDKIKTSPGRALYDGIDVTITITTNRGTHTVVNGSDDITNYKL